VKVSIKILHVSERVSKKGKDYKKVLVLIVIDGNEFVTDFIIYPTDDGNQSYKVDPRVGGRLINFRISSSDYWRLSSIYIDTNKTSGR